ncbi:uncharacterized protein ALTATR162_LOCUS9944 [Alternaria atra]|uniref:RRM domain-containing protein n=1 Tax=Alternaria atra TaxID=119953 RepID=A0A8J2N464_9PLEO|nr:uncharacterized protein ALTATR162_LOCUS9944 [Alternaria atra]CAG5182005.1 unnamed protein product [Alternaria atra]
MCYLELGSEAEAAKVIKELDGLEEQGSKMVAKPLKADFIWGDAGKRNVEPFGSRYFYDEGIAASDAIRPLLENRRTMLSVQTPGWSAGDRVSVAKQNASQIIERYFGKYGIERIGDISPFYGDKKQNPRLLCFMDFKTKEGAENAINDYHNTEIEGRLTWLKFSEPANWRSHQIGKVSPEALKKLQESSLVPKDDEIHEDKFANPLPKN